MPLNKKFMGVKPRFVRIGQRKVLSHGLERHFWTDIFHLSMSISWPLFFACSALVFLALNVIFTLLYALDPAPLANAKPGDLADMFFFSVQTLATVGYGNMFPQNHYANIVATVEVFTGITASSIATGLAFTRFSRPRPRFVFAKHPVVGFHNGRKCFMIRMANARHNQVIDAKAKVWLIRASKTLEGTSFRQVHRLPLALDEFPILTLGWTIAHVIDDKSPFHGFTPEDLNKPDSNIVISIKGFDKDAASEIYASKIYGISDIKWDYQYENIISDEGGEYTQIDYNKFHDVVEIKK